MPIIVVLPPINQFATKLELTRLAQGYAEQAAIFIARREASIEQNHPKIAAANRSGLKRLRTARTFDEFRRRALPTAQAILTDLARIHQIKVRATAISRVLAQPGKFPVITAWLNAQWYCAWIVARHRDTPAADKLDDFRHLIESARCDAFVTEEGDLVKKGAIISPSRRCMPWNQLRALLA